jgi:nitrilase
MGDHYPTVKLAAVQAASCFLDRERTTQKACSLIEEAGRHGAQVIGFPEGFIPAFPQWYHFHPAYSPAALKLSHRLFAEAVEVPSPTTEAIGEAARRAGAYVVIGVNERRPGSLGTLYNSLLFFSPEGELIGCHRKIMPTLTERLVHAAGDGAGLKTYDTPFGPIGGLICGENTNSFARMALLLQGERIHVAAWPAFPVAANSGGRGIDIRVSYHAFEGRVFVISAAGVLDEEGLAVMALTPEQRELIVSRGGHSGIVGPDGNYMVGPAGEEETILYADADLGRIVAGKYSHDLTGHYNRFDLFTLEVRTVAAEPLRRVTPAVTRP